MIPEAVFVSMNNLISKLGSTMKSLLLTKEKKCFKIVVRTV